MIIGQVVGNFVDRRHQRLLNLRCSTVNRFIRIVEQKQCYLAIFFIGSTITSNDRTTKFNTENRHVYKYCFIDSRKITYLIFLMTNQWKLNIDSNALDRIFFTISKIERSTIYTDVNNEIFKKN